MTATTEHAPLTEDDIAAFRRTLDGLDEHRPCVARTRVTYRWRLFGIPLGRGVQPMSGACPNPATWHVVFPCCRGCQPVCDEHFAETRNGDANWVCPRCESVLTGTALAWHPL